MYYFHSNIPFTNIADENYSGDPGEPWNVTCFNVETVTKKRANAISWSVGSCLSNGRNTCTANAGYFNNSLKIVMLKNKFRS